MPSNIQHVELTVEDILQIHRNWITKLFIDDNKTEAEIVNLLCDRRLRVSISQVRRCLRQWGVTSPTSSATSHSSSPARNMSRTCLTEPESRELYKQRPLPLLPKIPKTGPIDRVRQRRGAMDRMSSERPSFRRQGGISLSRIGTALDLEAEGSSPLEAYVMDVQTHELVAVGMGQPWRQQRPYL